MKRRMISAILALVLCMMLTLPAYAAPETDFVVDEWGVLASSELDELNEMAQEIYKDTGVGIFFVFSTEADLEILDPAQFAGSIKDYYIMIENDDYWWSFVDGRGKCVDEEIELDFRAAYNEADTYYDGIAAYYDAIGAYVAEAVGNSGANVETPVETPVETIGQLLVLDEADLLSDSEEAALNTKLSTISSTYSAQIVVGTIESMEGGDIDQFIELAYDEMGLGYGDNHDGVLLLVCMDPREYRILSNGFAGEAIDSGDIDDIGDAIVSDLSDGDYAAAFDEFVDQCDYYLGGFINGFPFKFGKNLLIALVIGIVAGLIVAFILKGQLKSVRQQKQANVYIKPGSMQLTTSNDFFLYRTVDRRKKESSSSGSSNSSGSSRSTGGGSF